MILDVVVTGQYISGSARIAAARVNTDVCDIKTTDDLAAWSAAVLEPHLQADDDNSEAPGLLSMASVATIAL